MTLAAALAGLLTGALAGMTGVGSGSLLTPTLLLLGVAPGTAVGTDLVVGLAIRLVGAVQYARQGLVDYRWGWRLAAGSLPGVLAGSWLFAWVQRRYGEGAAPLIRHALLAVVAAAAGIALACDLWHLWRRRRTAAPPPGRSAPAWLIPPVGALIGLATGFTSAGSGSLAALLLLACSGLTVRQVVGTDLAHAALLAAVGALVHGLRGGIDPALAASLLLGALPGVLLGSRMAAHTPSPALRITVNALIVVTGLSLR